MSKLRILSIFFSVGLFAVTNGTTLPKRSAVFRRQGATLEPTNIPSQCTNTCAPLFAAVQSCGSLNVACLCTATVRQNGVDCANCVASIFPSELSTLQAAADQEVQLCTQEGHPIDPVKLTGTTSSTASLPIATSASGSGTGSGSGGSSGTGTSNGGGTKPNGGTILIPSTSILGISAAFLFGML